MPAANVENRDDGRRVGLSRGITISGAIGVIKLLLVLAPFAVYQGCTATPHTYTALSAIAVAPDTWPRINWPGLGIVMVPLSALVAAAMILFIVNWPEKVILHRAKLTLVANVVSLTHLLLIAWALWMQAGNLVLPLGALVAASMILFNINRPEKVILRRALTLFSFVACLVALILVAFILLVEPNFPALALVPLSALVAASMIIFTIKRPTKVILRRAQLTLVSSVVSLATLLIVAWSIVSSNVSGWPDYSTRHATVFLWGFWGMVVSDVVTIILLLTLIIRHRSRET